MDTKQWYQSKAVWAGIVTAILGILGSLGIVLDVEVDQVVVTIMQIVTAVSGIMAIYGRMTADKKIGSDP